MSLFREPLVVAVVDNLNQPLQLKELLQKIGASIDYLRMTTTWPLADRQWIERISIFLHLLVNLRHLDNSDH